ncbi:hypothetical protein [Actinacidiphila reveromycinica]|uniref:hypothetical protein n=1 Tax=Actinacidiphila reveromycinica TaxID=659352 RepID=UPI0019225903|nr:hypothetical protein [Streptomyces sp. SN-593]
MRLEEIGATLLEPTWLGNQTSHRVRCAKGHHCTPRPTNVMSGQGICSICAGAWDVLYVVADQWSELVKVGITSGDPRPRLGEHRRQLGLDQVVRLLTGLPDGAAYQLEQTVLVALRDAGVYPVWGKETFYAPRALRRMLDLVDGYRPMSERHPE